MISRSKGQVLADLARRRCSGEAWEWLERVLFGLKPPLDPKVFGTAYSCTRRRLGNDVVTIAIDEQAAVQQAGLPVLTGWTLDLVGRAVLLLRATECLAPEEHAAFIDDVYRTGDDHERQSLLRTLSLLPAPERFVGTAADACRSNLQTVFEAIACENPYPAHYFPDIHFNQMVLKALFTKVPLRRIVGLDERITPELTRMVDDYARERRNAGRPVPDDLALISERGLGRR